jgi:hypothetical protein
MDAVISGSTPDHAKWGAYRSFARTYDAFAQEYRMTTGDRNVNTYDTEKLKGSMDTVWPVQKEIFDTIYADVLILSNLLSAYDVGISASISEIQDLLVANLRKVIFEKPETERDVQNAVEGYRNYPR